MFSGDVGAWFGLEIKRRKQGQAMTTRAAAHVTLLHKASREIKIFTTGRFHISANTGARFFQQWANPVMKSPFHPRAAW